MSPKQANMLLKASILCQDILSDVEASERLLNTLGFLPPAIIQAAAYIDEIGTTIPEYNSLFDNSELDITEVLCEEHLVHDRYNATRNSIATT